MMPQNEASEVIHQQADPVYRRYEGTQTSSARQHDETSYEQELREGPSSKVYPLPRDKRTILSFALVMISLVLLVLFGLLFVVVVGGTAGWISFVAACFVIMTVLAYAAYLFRPFGD